MQTLFLFSFSIITTCFATDSSNGISYKYLPFEPLMKEFQTLNNNFPNLIDFISIQKKYGISSFGDCGSSKCEVYYAHLSHQSSRLLNNDLRPEIFISGALHGNERVGPTTCYETSRLLLTISSCVEKASLSSIQDGTLCVGKLTAKDELSLLGGTENLNNNQNSKKLIMEFRRKRLLWIYRLLHTRNIYMMPTANAIGYYNNRREEGRIDPNRDFPFVQSKENCFQTVAARSMNELFREHMFQISVTFHGGMQAIAYEWGSPIHGKANHHDISPDDHSQSQIASSLSTYAGKGKYSNSKLYPYKPMNSLVYPVHGGMEDWAYGASWDLFEPNKPNNPTVPHCKMTSHSNGIKQLNDNDLNNNQNKQNEEDKEDYQSEHKTTYTDSMFRSEVFLIETSDLKTPSEKSLGSSRGLFLPKANDDEGNGHITRNIRLSLESIDLLEPYVEWDFDVMQDHIKLNHNNESSSSFQGVSMDAWIPVKGSLESGNNPGGWLWTADISLDTSVLSTASSSSNGEEEKEGIRVSWRVGGGIHVDQTYLKVGCLPPSSETAQVDRANLRKLKHSKLTSQKVSMGEKGGLDELTKGPQQSWIPLMSDASSSSPSSSTATFSPASGNARWAAPGSSFSSSLSSHETHVNKASSSSSSTSSKDKKYYHVTKDEMKEDGDVFHGTVPWDAACESSGGMYVMAVAKVDTSWGKLPPGAQPKTSHRPESHLSNARTNPDWFHKLSGQVVQGRDVWYSPPIRILSSSSRSNDSGGVHDEKQRMRKTSIKEEDVKHKQFRTHHSRNDPLSHQHMKKNKEEKEEEDGKSQQYLRQSSQIIDDNVKEDLNEGVEMKPLIEETEGVVEYPPQLASTLFKILGGVVAFRCMVQCLSALFVSRLERSRRYQQSLQQSQN